MVSGAKGEHDRHADVYFIGEAVQERKNIAKLAQIPLEYPVHGVGIITGPHCLHRRWADYRRSSQVRRQLIRSRRIHFRAVLLLETGF